jgi:hypothetical protein
MCGGALLWCRWRHWKAFYAEISQDIMEDMMGEMVKKWPVDDGRGHRTPTSLMNLGYLCVRC